MFHLVVSQAEESPILSERGKIKWRMKTTTFLSSYAIFYLFLSLPTPKLLTNLLQHDSSITWPVQTRKTHKTT